MLTLTVKIQIVLFSYVTVSQVWPQEETEERLGETKVDYIHGSQEQKAHAGGRSEGDIWPEPPLGFPQKKPGRQS